MFSRKLRTWLTRARIIQKLLYRESDLWDVVLKHGVQYVTVRFGRVLKLTVLKMKNQFVKCRTVRSRILSNLTVTYCISCFLAPWPILHPTNHFVEREVLSSTTLISHGLPLHAHVPYAPCMDPVRSHFPWPPLHVHACVFFILNWEQNLQKQTGIESRCHDFLINNLCKRLYLMLKICIGSLLWKGT